MLILSVKNSWHKNPVATHLKKHSKIKKKFSLNATSPIHLPKYNHSPGSCSTLIRMHYTKIIRHKYSPKKEKLYNSYYIKIPFDLLNVFLIFKNIQHLFTFFNIHRVSNAKIIWYCNKYYTQNPKLNTKITNNLMHSTV